MNDKEKLEAIGRRVNEVNYSITLLVNDIKKIFNKSLKEDNPASLGGEEIVALLGDILSGKIEKVSDVSDVY